MTANLPPYLVEQAPGHLEYQLPISVKLVVDHHGKVPLLLNERQEWELPGGKLEVGERPEDCASREVAEELGITALTDPVIIDAWVYQITPDRHVFVVSYGAKTTRDEPLRLSAEHKELGLFYPAEIPALHMPTPYKHTVACWMTRSGPGHRPDQPVLRQHA